MKMPVRCPCGTCMEWAMLEFQGEVETQDPRIQLNNLEVGTLCQIAKEKLKFQIGYHELEGTLTKLKKPVAILQKKFEVGETTSETELDTLFREGFEVVGVVRCKYTFKHRPRAMISKPEATKKRRVMANPFAVYGMNKGEGAPISEPQPPDAA